MKFPSWLSSPLSPSYPPKVYRSDLTGELLLTAELCGRPMSGDAACLLVKDLMGLYTTEQLFAALARCRVGIKGTLATEIITRIENAPVVKKITSLNGVFAVSNVSDVKAEPFVAPPKKLVIDEEWVKS